MSDAAFFIGWESGGRSGGDIGSMCGLMADGRMLSPPRTTLARGLKLCLGGDLPSDTLVGTRLVLVRERVRDFFLCVLYKSSQRG